MSAAGFAPSRERTFWTSVSVMRLLSVPEGTISANSSRVRHPAAWAGAIRHVQFSGAYGRTCPGLTTEMSPKGLLSSSVCPCTHVCCVSTSGGAVKHSPPPAPPVAWLPATAVPEARKRAPETKDTAPQVAAVFPTRREPVIASLCSTLLKKIPPPASVGAEFPRSSESVSETPALFMADIAPPAAKAATLPTNEVRSAAKLPVAQ